MNKEKLKYFKKLLETKKVEVESELKGITTKDPYTEENWESVFPKFDIKPDLEDASDEVEEYINRLPIEQTLSLKLKQINEALYRIKDKTYGICKNCKKETITLKRLEAIPEADMCIKCKKHKLQN